MLVDRNWRCDAGEIDLVLRDGQVLVTEDMLGLFERTPRFVKRFDDLAARIGEAAATYAAEVRSRAFPTEEQIYRAPK